MYIGSSRKIQNVFIYSFGVYQFNICHVIHIVDGYQPKSSEGQSTLFNHFMIVVFCGFFKLEKHFRK